MKFTENEINCIFDFIQEYTPFLKDEIVISKSLLEQEGMEDCLEEEGCECIKQLEGYTVITDKNGDHRNDGQMVDYTFTFISPTKETTEISTEMCLMVGWNHYQDVIIK